MRKEVRKIEKGLRISGRRGVKKVSGFKERRGQK